MNDSKGVDRDDTWKTYCVGATTSIIIGGKGGAFLRQKPEEVAKATQADEDTAAAFAKFAQKVRD